MVYLNSILVQDILKILNFVKAEIAFFSKLFVGIGKEIAYFFKII